MIEGLLAVVMNSSIAICIPQLPKTRSAILLFLVLFLIVIGKKSLATTLVMQKASLSDFEQMHYFLNFWLFSTKSLTENNWFGGL
jgi:hypothetical protein